MSAVPQTEVDPYETACDEIIARCGGEARGAVKALICANELLEVDLAKALASASMGYARKGSVKRREAAELD